MANSTDSVGTVVEQFVSQVQQFGQDVAQLWLDHVRRWERATEESAKLGRAWLDQCHDLYGRWRTRPQ